MLLPLIIATYDQFVKFDFYELDGVDARRRFIIIHVYNVKLDHKINLFVTYSEGQLTADPIGNGLIATVLCNYDMSHSLYSIGFALALVVCDNKTLVIIKKNKKTNNCTWLFISA